MVAVNEAAGKRGETKTSINWKAGRASNFGLQKRKRKKREDKKIIQVLCSSYLQERKGSPPTGAECKQHRNRADRLLF